MSFGEVGRHEAAGSRMPQSRSAPSVSWGPNASTASSSQQQRLAPPTASRRRPQDAGQSVSQISEWLRQFQQNLALLEGLGDSLDARSSDEALRQVSTQQEVVEELGATVRQALGDLQNQIERLPRAEQARPKAAHSKLKKDAERVSLDFTRVLNKIKQSRRSALAKKKPSPYNSVHSAATTRPYYSADGASAGPHRVGRAQFGPSDAPGDLDVMIGDERVQLQVAMQEEAINDAILAEREEEIREINQSVHKVNEIFRDLATLVDKQQNDVDQISELVEKSHQHAEKGLDQVQKAAKLQPSCTLS